jgi:hypothetical protein
MKIIYNKKLRYDQVEMMLKQYQMSGGNMEKIFIRKCDIIEVPQQYQTVEAAVLALGVKGGSIKNSHFVNAGGFNTGIMVSSEPDHVTKAVQEKIISVSLNNIFPK